MKNEKVSIVIPIYNSEHFLKSSLESALDQSYQNIEIIAVDDGSTDSSADILEQYCNKIKILRQENRGLSNTLNNGIKKMTGKWLKWLSPDDILYPAAIEVLVNEAKNFPENTIVYSNWEIIDEKENKLRDFTETNYNNLEIFDFNVRLLDDQHVNVNTSIIPYSLFDKGCEFQELDDPVLIDYDFFLRAGILYKTRFHIVPRSLLKYRIHKSQLSHKKISKTFSNRDKIRNTILAKLAESEKNQYLIALQEYKKKKPLPKKTMEASLKLASRTLPDWIQDRILLFYLNKIRRTR